MRTTLSIRDELYEEARRRAFEERRTLGDVVNELIERGLTLSATPRRRALGAFTGRILIGDDFDAPLSELAVSLERDVEP